MVPIANHHSGSKRARQEDCKWHDPCHFVEAVHRRCSQYCRPVFLHERLQNVVVIAVLLSGSQQLLAHAIGIAAAHVVAFKQYQVAAANKMHAAAITARSPSVLAAGIDPVRELQ